MDKKKLFTASLASVTVLGAGFFVSHPLVVKAAEDANAATTSAQPAATQPATATEAEKEVFLANFDKALEQTVKELEKADTQGDKALEKQKQETIKKLKAEAATNKAEIEEAFQNGATVADAEKLLEEIAKSKDKAVDAITNKALTPEEKAELKKAEEAGARTEWVAENGDNLVTEENGKWITYDGDMLITGDKGKLDKDYLGSHTHILEDGYTYVRTEKNGSLTRHIYSASPTIAKKTMWVDGDSDVILFEEKGFNEKNYVGHHDELLNKGYEFLGADWYDIEGETVTGFVYKKVRDATPAPAPVAPAPVAPANTATPAPVAPVTPAPVAPAAPAPVAPAAPAPVAPAPAVAGTSQDNTYQAPAAKAEDKKELPNTGGKDNVAVASLGFLGLLLGALPFVKRKN